MIAGNARIDAEELKAAAKGRWREILPAVCGIDGALLDLKHHPCPACGGRDRFRFMDTEAGTVICGQCFATDNHGGLAAVMHFTNRTFPEAIQVVADYVGFSGSSHRPAQSRDPMELIAKAKGVSIGALAQFGAKASGTTKIVLPMYDGSGAQCSTFTMLVSGGKGLNEKGKEAGCFLPINDDGAVRIPHPNEEWIVVEGVKDAARLWMLGYLAIGLPTASMNKRFAKLIKGVRVVIVPDRDVAGEAGAVKTARLLLRQAASVRIATLPSPLKEKDGDGVREVAKEEGGEKLVRQAITDAVAFEVRLPVGEGELPEVTLPGTGVTILSASKQLASLLDQTGKFFCRGGAVMRAEAFGDETSLALLKPAALCSDFETIAKLKKIQRKKEGIEIVDATCNEATAKLIIEAEAFRKLLSPIHVVSPCPVLIERDGRLIQVSSYDRESGILAAGPTCPEIPLDEAVALLAGLFDDFRFATAGDRARALAAVITPALVFGGLLGGRAPMDVGEADQSQSGKGFRNKVTATIYKATQRSVTQRTSGGVGSIQESFDRALIAAAPFIGFDNLRGNLDFPGLESFCTEDCYIARVPYSPPVEIDPRRVILMLTSNRAEMTVDLANRSSCVRILRQPDGYQFRAFPEGDLLDHVRANQPRFMGAVFSIIGEWYRRGKPELKSTAHDFRRWARVLGWITQNLLGAGDLLAGHREAQRRIASPGLQWLRDVALGVQRANKLDTWLRANDVLQVVLDQGIETAGIHGDADFDETDVWLKGAQTIGRKLGKLFTTDEVGIDSFQIQRRKEPDTGGRMKTSYAFFSAFPNDPQYPPIAPPIETRVSPIPPIETQEVYARVHTHAHSERVQPIGAIGGALGESDFVNPADCFHDWIDERPVDGRIRTSCRLCGKFYGNRIAPGGEEG